MALIKCDECGREISDKSVFCPGCGYPTHLNSALKDRKDNSNDTDKAPAGVESKVEPVKEDKPKAEKPKMEKPLPLERPKPTKKEAVKVDVEEPETIEMKQQLKEEEKIQEHIDEIIEQSQEENADLADYAENELDPEANEKKKVWLFLGVFGFLLVFIILCWLLVEDEEKPDGQPTDDIEAIDSVTPAATPVITTDTVAKADSVEDAAAKALKEKDKKLDKKADKAKGKSKPEPAKKPEPVPAHKAEPASTPTPSPAPTPATSPATSPAPTSNE